MPILQDEDDGSALLPVGPWLAAREGEKPVSRALHMVQHACELGLMGHKRAAELTTRFLACSMPVFPLPRHSPTMLRQCCGARAAVQVGVYALHDSKRNLQFVGYARNIVLAVRVR